MIVPTDIKKLNKEGQKKSGEDVNKNNANVEDQIKTKKVNSWASNYLQSIGHSSLKPIKINLSSSRIKECVKASLPETAIVPNKYQRVVHPNEPNETTIGIGNKDGLKPVSTNCKFNLSKELGLHVQETPFISKTEDKVPLIIPPDCCTFGTIKYSDSNYINSPAYAILPATSVGESTYYYNNQKCSVDLFDAIKSKINSEFAVEEKSRMMNLHKEMCENFIKEISINKSPEKRKAGNTNSSSCTKGEKDENSVSPSPAKKKKILFPDKKKVFSQNKTTKSTQHKKEIKKIVKKDKNINTKTKHLELDKVKKAKSQQVTDNTEKNKTSIDNLTPDGRKPHKNKFSIDPNDFKHLTNTKDKSESPEKNKLKRIRRPEELHTSIKSVVNVSENRQTDPQRTQCLDEGFDLRSKLSRINERIKRRNHLQRLKDADPYKTPMDNLKITVENQFSEKQKSPKKLGVLKYKSNKCKKLKLIINVVCEESDDDSSTNESSFSENENNQTQNMDLSFLDDFNVDEIVDSLKNSPTKKTIQEDNAIKENEPELKLSKILNILNAKSEANNNKNINSESNVNKIISNSVTSNYTSTGSSLVSHAEMIGEEKNYKKMIQSTHDLVRLLTKGKLQIDQPNTASLEESYQDLGTKKLATNTKSSEVVCEDDDKKLVMDEDGFFKKIKGPGSLISLVEDVIINHELLRNKKEENSKSVQHTWEDNKNDGKNNINKDSEDSVILIQDNIIDLTGEPTESKKLKKKFISASSELNNAEKRSYSIKCAEITTAKLEFVDLTDDSAGDKMKPNVTDNKSGTANEITSELSVKQTCLHLITLQDPIDSKSKDIKELLINQTQKNTNEKTNIDMKSKSVKEEIKNVTHESPYFIFDKNKVDDGKTKTHTKQELNDASSEDQKHELIPIEIPNHRKATESIVINEVANHETEDVHNENDVKKSIVKHCIEKESKIKLQINKDAKESQHTDKLVEGDKKCTTNIVEALLGTNDSPVSENNPDARSELNIDSEKESSVVLGPNNDRTNDSPVSENNSDARSELNIDSEKESSVVLGPNNDRTNDSPVSENNSDARSELNIDSEKESSVVLGPNNDITTRLSETKKIPVIKTIPASKEPLNKTTPASKEPLNKTPASKEPLNKTTPASKEPLNKTTLINKEQLIETTTHKELKTTNKEILNKTTPPTNKDALIKTPIKLPLLKTPTLPMLMEKKIEQCLHTTMKLIKLLHIGRFSKIFRCNDSSGQTYVAKLLKKHTGEQQNQMLTNLQQDIPKAHLNTVFLLDVFTVRNQRCLLLEYYPITLKHALKTKPFHINRVQVFTRQLTSAVMLLRKYQIIHSDIKPSHILLNANCNRLKLCGFDRATYRYDAKALPNIGTSNYRAPEIILGLSAGYSVDVWALALVLYEMTTKNVLFKGIYNNDILYQQMSIFGNLPWDMIATSPFQNQHFHRRIFMRRVGFKGQDTVLITRFNTTRQMQISLMSAYKEHWFRRGHFQWNSDMLKLNALQMLLEQMLCLDPRKRLAIEFILMDPFVFEVL